MTETTAEMRFEKAKALFDDEDYLEAINEFSVITLQHQGTAYADDAQYYLGECRFQRGEFLLAAFEYQQLMRNMPASPLVPDAQYKLGFCYYELSPKSSLDQQYSLKAIDEFQSFVEYYPGNPFATDAEQKIKELNSKLAKKEYDTARLYATLEYYRASVIYYDLVIEKYHDTDYAPLAYIGKAEALVERKRFLEARKVLERFLSLFPGNVLQSRATRMLEDIDERLR
jgi:outer membrane protein assembly factor BamD